MPHVIFIVLHLVCLFFFPLGLIGTIPLHIIYAAMSSAQKSNKAIEKNPGISGFKKCPDCAELIKLEARKCKHCSREFSTDETRSAWMDSLAPCCRERIKYGDARCFTCGRKLSFDLDPGAKGVSDGV